MHDSRFYVHISEDDMEYFKEEFGNMLDYANVMLKEEPISFVSKFLASEIPYRLEIGDSEHLFNRSGPELAREVLLDNGVEVTIAPGAHLELGICRDDNSVVFLAGQRMFEFQWRQEKTFQELFGDGK